MVYLYVALGGALGAMGRFFISSLVAFPYGTMAVNIIGSFLMGVLFVTLIDRLDQRASLFLMTGVLGGFTTFSAFSLDVFKLFEADRLGFAGLYVALSVSGALAALWIGIIVARGDKANGGTADHYRRGGGRSAAGSLA